MKASTLIKKLGKLMGKKAASTAGKTTTIHLAPPKPPEVAFPVQIGLGIIQLHENWRN
jgi:hypothetical protein